jgi:hypothetical protein
MRNVQQRVAHCSPRRLEQFERLERFEQGPTRLAALVEYLFGKLR